MQISIGAKKIITFLENAGYEAFAVGGCVRDYLMQRPCDDIDITTSATPIQTEKVLADNGIRFVETGLKHGTVTALVDGDTFEVTTYRTDGDYKDSRHPENVEFVTDIKEDLSRRDFTINAIAYSENAGFVDLFGGRTDINNKIIRAV
ncbi:MAG: polynucleotide adenylyltransferase, partial [Eubacterium sp.]|nr:polynucleotide adenylyltransferase [Eubacterium sp.]